MSAALKNDGTVWTWGYKWDQRVKADESEYKVPTKVEGMEDIIAITAADSYLIALKRDGTLWGWRYNAFGQLGIGNTTYRYLPTQVKDLTGIVAIAAGGNQTIALKCDGTLWSWGDNGEGQLGQKDINTTIPQLVKQ